MRNFWRFFAGFRPPTMSPSLRLPTPCANPLSNFFFCYNLFFLFSSHFHHQFIMVCHKPTIVKSLDSWEEEPYQFFGPKSVLLSMLSSENYQFGLYVDSLNELCYLIGVSVKTNTYTFHSWSAKFCIVDWPCPSMCPMNECIIYGYRVIIVNYIFPPVSCCCCGRDRSIFHCHLSLRHTRTWQRYQLLVN